MVRLFCLGLGCGGIVANNAQRHPALDPGSAAFGCGLKKSGIPDQVRGDRGAGG